MPAQLGLLYPVVRQERMLVNLADAQAEVVRPLDFFRRTTPTTFLVPGVDWWIGYLTASLDDRVPA
jgi:hypothetical protein